MEASTGRHESGRRSSTPARCRGVDGWHPLAPRAAIATSKVIPTVPSAASNCARATSQRLHPRIVKPTRPRENLRSWPSLDRSGPGKARRTIEARNEFERKASRRANDGSLPARGHLRDQIDGQGRAQRDVASRRQRGDFSLARQAMDGRRGLRGDHPLVGTSAGLPPFPRKGVGEHGAIRKVTSRRMRGGDPSRRHAAPARPSIRKRQELMRPDSITTAHLRRFVSTSAKHLMKGRFLLEELTGTLSMAAAAGFLLPRPVARSVLAA